MRRVSRVTLDIDGHVHSFELRAVRAYYALQQWADEVDVSISSSGEGIHLIGWFSERLDDEQKRRIRRNLGDDPNRIRLDRMRGQVGHTRNVLWTRKQGKQPDEDFDDIHAALEAINRSQPIVRRFRAAVQNGLVR
jgi:hypothetical protein